MKYEKMIDHTYLKPEGTKENIDKLISEAKEFNFGAICINPCWIEYAKKQLINTDIKIVTVIGFPLGSMSTESKIFEAKDCLLKGADEIDMVINIGKLKEKDYDYVLNEIRQVKSVCQNKVLKVIIETALLTEEEIIEATKIVINSEADYIKTSTGFSTRGANKRDIEIFNDVIKSMNSNLKIKAAGGIKSFQDIIDYTKMGVERFGTSSSVKIFTNQNTLGNEY